MRIFWVTTGDEWIKKRNTSINARLGPQPSQMVTDERYLMDNAVSLGNADFEWQKQWDKAEAEWFASLPPGDAQKAYDAFAARNAAFDRSFKIGQALALSIIGAAAGGAALTAAGVIGEGAAVAATAGEAASTGAAQGGFIDALGVSGASELTASTAAANAVASGAVPVFGTGAAVEAALLGPEAGLGYGGYGGAGGTVAGQSGILGGTSVASGASALGQPQSHTTCEA